MQINVKYSKSVIMKSIFVACFVLLSVLNISAENYKEYLEASRNHIKNGNIEKAESCYVIYVKMTGKIDVEIEHLLKEYSAKEAEEKPKPPFKDPDNVLGFAINGVWLDFVYVDGGTFIMGATEEQGLDAYDVEKPAHKVKVDDFMISQTEVTQGLWIAVMGEPPTYYMGDDYPVVGVSWNVCQVFLNRLSSMTGGIYRLPTEAEWEYAARGGNISYGFKYSGSNNPQNVACYNENSSDIPNKVKSKAPNELGIYDMSGNVAEWCQDWWADYTSDYSDNPCGPSNGEWKIIRGGAYSHSESCCRVSDRDYRPTDYAPNYSGFRICVTPINNKLKE